MIAAAPFPVPAAGSTGVSLYLVDDQTNSTRQAISLMQNNALIGLILVLLITWIFLGTRIAFFTSIGIPFTLAKTERADRMRQIVRALAGPGFDGFDVTGRPRVRLVRHGRAGGSRR